MHNREKTHCKRGHAFTPENTYVQHTRGRSATQRDTVGRGCRQCRDEYWEQWRAANQERLEKLDRDKRYGTGAMDIYNQRFASQKGCCAICGKHQANCNRKLNQDHSHKSRLLRGLLCDHCNKGIGYFLDDPTILLKAIAYLKSWQVDEQKSR